MPRKPTGQVIERETREGRVLALRFRAYGDRQYVRLGLAADGWSRERAERELRHVLADVERGIWVPAVEAPPIAPADPGFHAFASEWLAARRGELRDTTIADYSWQLSNHLLPFFHRHRLSQITVAEVDRYREHKVREGALAYLHPRHAARRGCQAAPEGARRGPIGHQWAPTPPTTPPRRLPHPSSQTTKDPQVQGLRTMGAAGFEPATSRV
jgi:Phage integrase, N-terminal SAM-like domain